MIDFLWNLTGTGYGGAILAVLIIFGCAAIVLLPVLFLFQRFTNGRALLYKYTQDYGKGHTYTISALENCIRKMLKKDGMQVNDVSLFHEYGNRYKGTLVSEGKKRRITVYTDGWKVEYEIAGRKR